MPKLTVLIPCKDEIQHIRACIDSVRPIADEILIADSGFVRGMHRDDLTDAVMTIADEILIADSGSTDGTLETVRRMPNCRVIEREYVNSADFKNWAIPQATHEWVLVVDADERVTPALAREIKVLSSKTPSSRNSFSFAAAGATAAPASSCAASPPGTHSSKTPSSGPCEIAE